MLLLISDANILMDVEVGDLVAPMFSLGYQFAVPDIQQPAFRLPHCFRC